MALSGASMIEVRSDGSDNNGGGCNSKRVLWDLVVDASDNTKVTSAAYTFVSGDVGSDLTILGHASRGWTRGIFSITAVASGVATLSASPAAVGTKYGVCVLANGRDYSRQTTAQKSGTDLEIHATDNTKVKPVAAGVAAADVGNWVNITAGAGFTTGVYSISSQDGTWWTLDRAAGTVGSTGGTYAMGGAFATIDKGLTIAPAECTVWARASATYNISAALAPTNGAGNYLSSLIGYGTQRGDGTRATIATNGNAINAINLSQTGWKLGHLILDGAAGAGSQGLIGINSTAQYNSTYDVWVKDFANEGIKSTAQNLSSLLTEVSGCGGTNGAIDIGAYGARLWGCYSHNNTKSGLYGANNTLAVVEWSVFANNTGASSDGISGISYNASVHHNICYGNGRDGIRWASFAYTVVGIISSCRSNIFMNNGGYGQNHPTAVGTGKYGDFSQFSDYNAYYNNTSGAINSTQMGHGEHDVLLTGDPFTDAANGDFGLNNTAGAGAACRSVGFPGAIAGLAELGYSDIGVYRHEDPTGGGGLLVHLGMGGGMRG